MRWLRKGGGIAVMVAALSASGCGLEEVEIPELSGPSGLGLLLRLNATPDVLLADGESQAVVEGRLTGPNGQALPNREILFSMIDDATGLPPDEVCFLLAELEDCLGRLEGGAPLGPSSMVAVTDSQGTARVRYVAPFTVFGQTFQSAPRTMLIVGRPVGSDEQGEVFRAVRIQLISR